MEKSKGEQASKYSKAKPVWTLIYPPVCECGKSNEHFRNWKWHLGTVAAFLVLFLSILPFCFSSPDSARDAYVITHDSAQAEVFIGGQQACNGDSR
jgi:hypothetical protein